MAFLPGATNFWRRIVFQPCARPWYVYVEAFVPAIIEAVITVRIIDMEDIMRDKAKDFAGPGARTTRRGLRHTRKPIFYADHTPAQRYSQKALAAVLRFSQPIENIGFKFLLIGAADQFFYRFTSLIINAPYCETPGGAGPLQRSRTGGNIGILPGGAAIAMNVLEQNRANWSTNAFSCGLPSGTYCATLAVNITAPTSGINGVTCRLLIQGALLLGSPESEEQNLGPSESADFILTVDFRVPVGFTAAVAWELVGPAVPVGVASASAYVGIFRND